ncbi:hypothetical protein OBBRIDRAFT_631632 [Obba rivulosa]|uniref:Uncharacterized protein n=1 Tax=Obba rivulosa TaxID=1052685 RepID=A0A8E2ATC7_9APHY|nr:hypothetical protein OBBRIDRAFT_631632 [Obba rivulosa]
MHGSFPGKPLHDPHIHIPQRHKAGLSTLLAAMQPTGDVAPALWLHLALQQSPQVDTGRHLSFYNLRALRAKSANYPQTDADTKTNDTIRRCPKSVRPPEIWLPASRAQCIHRLLPRSIFQAPVDHSPKIPGLSSQCVRQLVAAAATARAAPSGPRRVYQLLHPLGTTEELARPGRAAYAMTPCVCVWLSGAQPPRTLPV